MMKGKSKKASSAADMKLPLHRPSTDFDDNGREDGMESRPSDYTDSWEPVNPSDDLVELLKKSR